QFVIANNSLFDVQNDADVTYTGFGTIPTFTIGTGSTLRKSAGTGDSFVNFGVTNSGSVEGQTGTLRFGNGGSATGSFTATATLGIDGGTFNLNAGSSVSGAGIVRFRGGPTNVAGTYAL